MVRRRRTGRLRRGHIARECLRECIRVAAATGSGRTLDDRAGDAGDQPCAITFSIRDPSRDCRRQPGFGFDDDVLLYRSQHVSLMQERTRSDDPADAEA